MARTPKAPKTGLAKKHWLGTLSIVITMLTHKAVGE